jgi:hypothetical protein
MSISFRCDGCGKVYKTSDQWAGRKVQCKQCGEPVLIPAAPAEVLTLDDPYGLDEAAPTLPPRSSNPYEAPKTPLRPSQEADLSDGASDALNPWVSVWTRPRATMKFLVKHDPDRHVLLLAVLGGIVGMLGNATFRNFGELLPLGGVLLVALIGGPISGLISLYLSGALLSWSGKKLGGRADSDRVRLAVAWSSVPTLVAGVLYLPLILVLGNDLFKNKIPGPGSNPLAALLMLVLGTAQVVLGIWSLVLYLKCLGQVHRFSAWTALAAVLLGGLVIVLVILLPIIIIAVIVGVRLAAQ